MQALNLTRLPRASKISYFSDRLLEPNILIRPEPENEDSEFELPLLADLISEGVTDGKLCCPFHEDHVPSLQVYPDHYHCYVCGAHGTHIDWLTQVEGMSREEAHSALRNWDGPVSPALPPRNDNEKLAFALRLWEEAKPIASTLAAQYLETVRRIDLAALPADIDQALRFHPRCPFGSGTYHPCLLALMRNASTDAPTGIQRTALTPEGQKIDRRMLGKAGTVKLWPAEYQLVVGEGLETVLAAATRLSYLDVPLRPAWAALSAPALGAFPVLSSIEQLIILVDHDQPGELASRTCTVRWQRARRTVVQLKPDKPGADFNDLVMSEHLS
jgi:hypothetical protein